jgi:peptidoglycan lytic transglycosylase D
MQRLCGLLVCLCIAASGCANLHGAQVKPVTFVPLAPAATAPTVEFAEAEPANVWDVIRAGLVLDDEIDHASVARAVDDYLSADALMPALEPRANRYFAYVVSAVAERDLPMELALLPIVESTLNPYAFSAQGAAGLWQLIPSTARHHGVTIDWWYDGRRDLIDSTTAALDYLTYLYDQFGDWLLAIAAYNAGEGRVRRALREDPGADFFHLKLPRETREYVPRVLALAHLIGHDGSLDLPDLAVDPPFFVATVDRQIDLETLSTRSALSLDDIFAFNPGLNRRATPPGQPFRMLIPASLRTDFEAAIDRYPNDAPQWQRHRVRRGESLISIAKRYGSSVAAIRKQNGISGSLIHPGQVLLVASVDHSDEALASNPMLPSTAVWQRYKIRPGDSLWTISRKFHTPIATLVEANQLNSAATLRVGQLLAIPGRSATQRIVYTVRRGDSLARIAARYRVSVAQIVRWNGVDPAGILHPGVQLVLHVDNRRDWT